MNSTLFSAASVWKLACTASEFPPLCREYFWRFWRFLCLFRTAACKMEITEIHPPHKLDELEEYERYISNDRSLWFLWLFYSMVKQILCDNPPPLPSFSPPFFPPPSHLDSCTEKPQICHLNYINSRAPGATELIQLHSSGNLCTSTRQPAGRSLPCQTKYIF